MKYGRRTTATHASIKDGTGRSYESTLRKTPVRDLADAQLPVATASRHHAMFGLQNSMRKRDKADVEDGSADNAEVLRKKAGLATGGVVGNAHARATMQDHTDRVPRQGLPSHTPHSRA